jgi:hypothetical protein
VSERRPTPELLVIMFAATICAVLLVTALTVLVLEAVRPDADTSDTARAIGDLMNTMLGLVVGFLAGRAHRNGRPPS